MEKELKAALHRQVISPRTLTCNLSQMPLTSRLGVDYKDPLHLPFFYHLGKQIHPQTLLNIGVGLALESCCFLKGSPHSYRFFGYEAKNSRFYSARTAKSNLRNSFKGDIEIQYEEEPGLEGEWDVVLITEDLEYLSARKRYELAWKHTMEGGYLVIDDPVETALKEFLKVAGKEAVIYDTRNKTGVIWK